MDFFAAQARARRLSRLLLLWFALAIAAIALTIYLAVVLALGDGGPLWQPGLLLFTLFATGLVIGGGALYRIAELAAGGGAAVAASLGGRRLAGNAGDPAERRLQNVVEEMAIAAGLPVPAIYVLDDEPAINAFAAGMAPQQAVVAVTRGALEQLTRDELQGVVGHEFSHILNGDMRLNMRLVGLLHGLLLLTLAGRVLLRSGARGGRRSGGSLAALGIVLVVGGWLGVLFGRLIQAAVSRQREFLADASAVQFTRNPQGIADALRRIAKAGSALSAERTDTVAHMLFGQGRGLSGGLATHPPIGERLRRLLGQRGAAEVAALASATAGPARAQASTGASGFAAGAAALAPGTARSEAVWEHAAGRVAAVEPIAARPPEARASSGGEASAAVAQSARAPIDFAHLAAAREALASIPPPVRRALEGADGARATIFALLLASDPSVRAAQLKWLPGGRAGEVERLAAQLPAAGSALRMAVLDLALGALQTLGRFDREALIADVERFVRADGRVVLAEYLLLRALRDALLPPPPALPLVGPAELRVQVQALLSFFAHAGHVDAGQAAAAYAHGAARSPLDLPGEPLPRGALRIEMLDAAFTRLAGANPAFRARLVDALAEITAYDRRISAPEAELLRVAAGALGVPLALPATGDASLAASADAAAPTGAPAASGRFDGPLPASAGQGWQVHDRLPLKALLVANLLPIPGVLFFGWDVASLLLFYWIENLVIGFYTALRMLRAGGAGAIPQMAFFLFHYGAFCGAHGVFLVGFLQIGGGGVLPFGGDEWWGPLIFLQLLIGALAKASAAMPSFFWLPLIGLLASHGFSWYAHHVIGDEDRGRKAEQIMFDPYPRMVVLHVAIIFGGMAIIALGSPLPMLVLLIALKVGVDVGLHRRAHARRAAERAQAAAQLADEAPAPQR
jgi:Zn-dependent protease with chaperone function